MLSNLYQPHAASGLGIARARVLNARQPQNLPASFQERRS
jgi:hypothetical protein